MRLDDSDAQIALAAVQVLERQLADRLEDYAEPTGHAAGTPDEMRRTLDEHDRVTHLVRALQMGVGRDLFDWEVALVRDCLQRYQTALREDHTHLIADENSRIIQDDAQRESEARHAAALLEKLQGQRSRN